MPSTLSLCRLAAIMESGLDLNLSKCATLSYTYDFGDNWRHTISIEAVEDANPALEYSRFLDGERRAPRRIFRVEHQASRTSWTQHPNRAIRSIAELRALVWRMTLIPPISASISFRTRLLNLPVAERSEKQALQKAKTNNTDQQSPIAALAEWLPPSPATVSNISFENADKRRSLSILALGLTCTIAI